MEEDTVQALMDLALPRFKKPDDGATPRKKPWPVALSSAASPTSVDGGNWTRSPSPCVDLDVLSSDDSEVDVTPQDFRLHYFANPTIIVPRWGLLCSPRRKTLHSAPVKMTGEKYANGTFGPYAGRN